MEEIVELIVHHSASPLTTTLGDIEEWHREKGWDGCGYHYVIEMHGGIRVGRSLPKVGAHARPNTGRIGICLVGDNTDEFEKWTHAQVESLLRLYLSLRVVWPGLPVYGHRDVNAGTECPGVDVRAMLLGPSNMEE